MSITIRKYRLANPSGKAGRKPARSTRAKRRANPGTLVTLGFANPHKGRTMKRRKNSATKRAKRSHRRKNPIALFSRKRKTVQVRRRRRNPSAVGSLVGSSTDLMKNGASALVGLVAARQLPQMVLGAKNTGLIGYVATAIATFGTAYAIRQAAGAGAANAAMIGGAMQFASRMLNEYVSPVGKMLSLSGIGDATAASLGEIRQSYFPVPVATRPGTMDAIIPKALQPPAAPAPAATMSGAPARRNTRFASRF